MKTLAWIATIAFFSLGAFTAYWVAYRPSLIIQKCQAIAMEIKHKAMINPEADNRLYDLAYRTCLRQKGLDP